MKLPFTLAALLALAATSPVQAMPIKFTISGGFSATFWLDTEAVPDFSDPEWGVGYVSVPGFSGTPSGTASIQFFPDAKFGGLLIADPDSIDWLLEATGPQLYTGPETDPKFLLGSFDLTGLSTPGDYTITIEAIPEPATWAMMIGGFAMAGAALRRRQQTVRYIAA
jgi:hypothetical protein